MKKSLISLTFGLCAMLTLNSFAKATPVVTAKQTFNIPLSSLSVNATNDLKLKSQIYNNSIDDMVYLDDYSGSGIDFPSDLLPGEASIYILSIPTGYQPWHAMVTYRNYSGLDGCIFDFEVKQYGDESWLSVYSTTLGDAYCSFGSARFDLIIEI